MSSIREIGRIGLPLCLLLVLSCESASEAADPSTSAPSSTAATASAIELGAGGEVQLSDEDLERLLEALERELAAASRNQ
jgi:hypothetical protein